MIRIFILLLPIFSFGQTINTTTRSGEQNIYNDAIKHFITFASKSDKSVFDTVSILKDGFLTDSLQSTIQRTKIVLIDSMEMSNRLKKNKSFIAYKIFPMNFDREHFYINIVPFRVHREKEETVLENTGTCIVSYIYDNNKKSFKFYRSACRGF